MKKRSKNAELAELSWRPDFRDADSLPDIKTVRTSFFVSALALSLAIISLMQVGFQEYSIFSAKSKVDVVTAEIASRQGVHAKAIGMNNQFIEKSRRIDEIDTFEGDQMIASDLLLDVGANLLPGMALLSVEFNEDKTVFHGLVDASQETDSLLKQYMEKLQTIELLADRYDEFTQVSVERQAGSNQIRFHLEASRSQESGSAKRKS